MQTLTKVVIFTLLFILSGCSYGDDRYQYYLDHPSVLMLDYEKCQAADLSNTSGTKASVECAVVMRVYNDLQTFHSEMEADPLAFGHHIMTLQNELVTAKVTTAVLPASFDNKANNSVTRDAQTVDAAMQFEQGQYQQSHVREQIQAMMAILKDIEP